MTEKTVYVCDFCGTQIDDLVPFIRIPCGSKSQFLVQDNEYHSIIEVYETLHFCNTEHFKAYIDKAISEKT